MKPKRVIYSGVIVISLVMIALSTIVTQPHVGAMIILPTIIFPTATRTPTPILSRTRTPIPDDLEDKFLPLIMK